MAVSRGLRRLFRIRDLEEEQCRLALESATGTLHRLQHALEATVERGRRGRRWMEASIHSGELTDRLAGMEEMQTAGRHAAALAPRIADAELDVAALRGEFLAKRVERRQAETLIEETEARDAVEAGRRAQQDLDDWFGNRMHRRGVAAAMGKTTGPDGPDGSLGRPATEEASVPPGPPVKE
jgi:flagellar biosynthesis chaperone FliJ